jgi:signal transduction histidine kinase
VYRIVQEALTNVGKHAGEAHASVHIDYGTQELTVRVDDDGGAPPDAGQVPGRTTDHHGLADHEVKQQS